MTRQQLRRQIADLAPWFHNLRLHGIETAPDHFLGDYPARHWKTFQDVLPEDLRGWTVLDVGCNAGYFSIQLKQRGADRVLGIDTNPRYLAQARLAAAVRGADVEFRQMAVYELAGLREQFDLVLFLGVLYHLRYPLLALDLLRAHAVRRLLLCQTMLRGAADAGPLAPDYPFTERAVFERTDFPRLHFIEHKYAGDATNWWVPNSAGAAALLRSAGFTITARPVPEVFLCEPVPLPAAQDHPELHRELAVARLGVLGAPAAPAGEGRTP